VPALLAAGAAALWWIVRDDFAMKYRGGAGTGRDLAGAATCAAPLDVLPMLTPDGLRHFGPTVMPADWVRHRMRYDTVPGRELQRLIHGAPGACTPPIPRALRGWIYDPPAEKDY
jgi:hypothetical protein